MFLQENQLSVTGGLDYDTAFAIELRLFEQASATDEMYEKAIELLNNKD